MGFELSVCPGPRAPVAVVQAQAANWAARPELTVLLNAVPTALLILNSQRQIVLANRALTDMLSLSEAEQVFGLRPGEAMRCEHAAEEPGGCGMSEACRTCGAARAITVCERGAASVQECRIIQRGTGRALDFRVSTTPFTLQEEQYTILALTDISHEKRRQVMERIFFHDLLNTSAGVMGCAQLLSRLANEEQADLCASVVRLAGGLAEEIQAQRELVAAENNDLAVQWGLVNSRRVLAEVAEVYAHTEAAQERVLAVDAAAAEVEFSSDRRLLARVIGNMVKNALEASGVGQTVRVGCCASATEVEFWVQNPGVMERQVQLQVFQRSFSTKGYGRGLGTYSIKLLTERYLKGRAGFSSSVEAGTMFKVAFPVLSSREC